MAGSFEALATFALGAIPGIVVVEFLEYGRPRLRERAGAQAVGSYLILSLLVWGLAALCFEADGRLAAVLDASGQRGREQIEVRRRADSPRAYGRLGDLIVQAFTFSFAWDRLLERLNRTASPQLVHVRLRDGGDVYGVMAEGGSADFHSDGRGLVLDAELLRDDGRLRQMPNSSGVFIASEAVASVAFGNYTPAESSTIDEDE